VGNVQRRCEHIAPRSEENRDGRFPGEVGEIIVSWYVTFKELPVDVIDHPLCWGLPTVFPLRHDLHQRSIWKRERVNLLDKDEGALRVDQSKSSQSRLEGSSDCGNPRSYKRGYQTAQAPTVDPILPFSSICHAALNTKISLGVVFGFLAVGGIYLGVGLFALCGGAAIRLFGVRLLMFGAAGFIAANYRQQYQPRRVFHEVHCCARLHRRGRGSIQNSFPLAYAADSGQGKVSPVHSAKSQEQE